MAAAIRKDVIDQSMRVHVGHIGSALSIADMLAALYSGPLAEADPVDPDRDRFVLSKGHAALGFYAALHACGRLSGAQLNTYLDDGSQLVGHPEHDFAEVEFSTGSLGQGVTMATGAALAGRIQGSDRRVYALLSDAECDEGCVWEAAMFAAHHRLSNLVLLVDVNGQQALGYTKDVLNLEPLVARWDSFGWRAVEVDGHDAGAMITALAAATAQQEGPPSVILCRTTFGKGVSFMEGKLEWHYLPMSDVQYARATRDLLNA